MTPTRFLAKKTVNGRKVYVSRYMAEKKPTKRSLSKISDETYMAKYPNSWQLYSFFQQTLVNAGYCNNEAQRAKSRTAAYDYCEVQNIPVADLKTCVLWAFSKECNDPWLKRIPLNHLGSLASFYNAWRDSVKESASGLGDYE